MAKKTSHDNVVNLLDRRLMEGLIGQMQGGAADPALQEAQELIYQAWESDDPVERIELAEEALTISPNCADAWVLLVEESAETLDQALEYYRKGMEAGERALGEKTFGKDKGHFRGILETRPYMRARLGLAQCLWEKGDREAAIGHYQQMLELNSNDNQGVRHILLGCLLDEQCHDEAEALLDTYAEDPSAVWCYSRVLLAYRREGDSEHSRVLRKAAIEQNKFVPDYLTGRRKLPKYPRDYIGFGDKNEAIAYVFDNRKAWRDTPGTVPWLLRAAK